MEKNEIVYLAILYQSIQYDRGICLPIENKDITITSISFSPVSKKETEEEEEETNEIRQGIIQTTNLDERILDLFKEYIKYLFNHDKRSYSADIKSCEESEIDIKEKLDECLGYDFTQDEDKDKFQHFSKYLAQNLIYHMSRSTTPKPGILFVMIAEVSEVNHVFILKVDLEKEIIQIWVDEENLNLNIDEVKNAMPTPEQLQKGAAYPHPAYDKDYKIIQESYLASYFDKFLQCDREEPEYKQFKIVNDVVKVVRNEFDSENEMIQPDLIVNEYFKDMEDEIFDRNDLIECGKKVAPHTNDEDIKRVITRELEARSMPDIYIPKNTTLTNKIEITIGDITIRGPYQSMIDKVKIEPGDGIYLISVKGSTCKKKIKR
ncbi:nucleoid-associated protein [Methanolobus sp. WCC1]|uniref:nucleoid-associated protein n=1 Tax=unclassified Methanolobus TaxID=2629569 RepID=UPI00324A5FB7